MSTEKIASRSQLLDLAGRLAQNMPADLSVEIAKEWFDDPSALQRFLAGLREGTYPIADVKTLEFEVIIDPKRTIEQWVKAGEYDYVNPNISTANFGQFLTVNKDATEPYKAKVVAFCLGRSATIDKAKRVRQRLNLKPIGFEHQAAVGEQHKEVQCELYWLVNPDAVWVNPDGNRDVSFFYGDPDCRDFNLNNAGNGWRDNAWFFGLSE